MSLSPSSSSQGSQRSHHSQWRSHSQWPHLPSQRRSRSQRPHPPFQRRSGSHHCRFPSSAADTSSSSYSCCNQGSRRSNGHSTARWQCRRHTHHPAATAQTATTPPVAAAHQGPLNPTPGFGPGKSKGATRRRECTIVIGHVPSGFMTPLPHLCPGPLGAVTPPSQDLER